MSSRLTNVDLVPLEAVATFVRGITFKPDELIEGDVAGAVACMRTKNVQADLDESDLLFVPDNLVKREEQFLLANDILVSTANSWELVGKACWVPKLGYRATAGGFISILRANPHVVVPRYLFYWLTSPEVQLKVRYCGRKTTNISNLNHEQCLGITIPLPPLAEQRRIAEILDKADSIRRNRDKAILTVGEIKRSQFQAWFAPWFQPKAERNYVPVSNFVSRFEGGLNVATPEKTTPETRHFILKVSAVTWGDYRPAESKPLPPDFTPPVDHIVRKGDLLFSRANTTELVGATAFVFDTPSDRVLPDKLWRFVWKNPREIEPLFVWALFNHPRIRYEIGRRATGTSGSMKNISMEKVMSIRVPFPGIEVQRRFARFITEERTLRIKMAASADQAVSLFNCLVQRAFRGEL